MDDTGNTALSSNMLSGVLAQNSAGQNVTGAVVTASASDTDPAMDGTADPGSASTYSRGDHVHPTDTSRQAKITASGLLKGNGSGGVSAAVAGTDYAAASHGTHVTYSTSNPVIDGTASPGTASTVARSDHKHPTDTTRQAKITASGILKGDGSGGVSAAVAGTDYIASHQDISGKLNTNGNGSNVTVAFTQASTRTNIATGGTLATAFSRISKWLNDLGSLAFKSTVAKSDLASGVQTSLDLADTALQSYTETDPTVPSWAKASSKPSYTASEVGAVPTSRTVNGKALSANISLSASDVGALPDSTTIPTASTTNPSMDGTASYGSGTSYARSNHVHPTDTSRQAKITASGMLKGDGSGGVSAATAGTDYAAASHTHSNYAAKTTITTGTLTATSWSGSTYSALQTSYPAASYDIEIEPNGDSCTAEQYAAWGAAQLVGSATTNVLTALGTVPTVNIPIVIKVTAK